jgi:predicted cupin superfamily sugar epimerase
MTADEIIEALGLRPHPEGGHYAETWRRAAAAPGERAAGTAIHFLLRAGERSHWHRVDAAEVWLYHAGAPIELSVADAGGAITTTVVGPAVTEHERPQAVVPANAWQSAVSSGEWTLVSCIVVPGFEFAGFELAPPGWRP